MKISPNSLVLKINEESKLCPKQNNRLMVAKCATTHEWWQNRRLSTDRWIDQTQREIHPEAITKKAFTHLDSSLCIFALQSETYSTTAINTVSLKKRFCKKKSLAVSVRTFSSLPCEEDVADNNPSFFGSFPTWLNWRQPI